MAYTEEPRLIVGFETLEPRKFTSGKEFTLGSKGAILVVDDEPESLRLMVEVLEKEGYDVRAVDTGELALASAAVKIPDLILLDIRMPVMDGFEVCGRLKASLQTRNVPVMFISAATAAEEHVKCFRYGAVAFVNKPVTPEELLARVRTHVELGRLRARLERQVAERTAELQSAYDLLQRELAEREQAERAVRESEERFRNMADTAPVLIWVSGPDKLVTFLNKGWLSFRGRTEEQEIGNGWADGVHPEDLDRCIGTYNKSFDARHGFEMEYRLRRADGEYRWVLDCGVPRITSNGDFAGYIGSCVDITDLRRSHEERLAAQKMESLGVLAAGIAHDFNNLLGSILAESDLALSDLRPNSGSREQLEKISALAVRGSEIVDLLMSFAGTGHAPAPEPVDLSALVAELLNLMNTSLPKQVLLKSRLASDLPPVLSSAPQVRRVVMNLVKNAGEAMEGRPGSITVSTSLEHVSSDSDAARKTGLAAGDHVRVRVSDAGRGMTEDSLAKAFDPFYSTKFAGRGLGLSVVQGIVRSHGGAVQVKSRYGLGTTVDVLLPCCSEAGGTQHVSTGAPLKTTTSCSF